MRNPSSAARGGGGGSSTSNKTPCCSKVGLKRGPWTPEEDERLSIYIKKEGEGRWRTLPERAGLLRCGKSCRLRWMNYLHPSVNRDPFSPDEEDLIVRLHRLLGNRWSLIAGRIPGRTDNHIKNYWNNHLSKKLISQGMDPRTHNPFNPVFSSDHTKASSSKTNGLPTPYPNGYLFQSTNLDQHQAAGLGGNNGLSNEEEYDINHSNLGLEDLLDLLSNEINHCSDDGNWKQDLDLLDLEPLTNIEDLEAVILQHQQAATIDFNHRIENCPLGCMLESCDHGNWKEG